MLNIQLPRRGVYCLVLGIMQDAGVPHAGCRCSRCMAAFNDPTRAEYAAALAIVDARQRTPSVWLVDATPDIKYQLNLLAPMLGPSPSMPDRLRPPDGLFLTHAHMGHTAGLVHLGPEAMNVSGLPIYASPGLCHLLQENGLWRPLIERVDLRPMITDQALELADQLIVKALAVPHRDELNVGTYAFHIQGPQSALLYVPDIDDWARWSGAPTAIADADVALVDASFYSRDELGGRPPVAHPLVPETLAFIADLRPQLLLTHLNHTNPLLDVGGPSRLLAGQAKAAVAATGQIITL